VEKQARLKSPNHFRSEIGRLGPKKMKKVRKLLREFLRVMGQALGPSARLIRCVSPETKTPPCTTCALNPGTFRFKGFVGTSYGFLKALRDRKIFLCHDNQPQWRKNILDPEKVRVCRSWLVLQAAHPGKIRQIVRLFDRGLREIAASK